MIRKLKKLCTLLALFLWVATTTPFFSVYAISTHGHHDTSLALHDTGLEIAFHHGKDVNSHSHEESHQQDSEDHHATVSLTNLGALVQVSLTVPEPLSIFVMQTVLPSSEHLGYFSNCSRSLERIERAPPSQAFLKSTVLLI
jgi:hypothetical protein